MLQLKIVKFPQNSYIVVEGRDSEDNFYIIQKGNIRCYKATGSGIAPVIYGPGDFVGVVPCMSGHLQIETAIAMTDVQAIAVKKDQYPDLIAQNTPVALKIIKTFANRMRVMNQMLTKATVNASSVNENHDQIFQVAQYYDKQALSDIAVFAYYQFLKTRPVGPACDYAKQRFTLLKPKTHAVFYEPTPALTRSYPINTMVFSEAQNGSDMFIIQRGEIAITKVVNGKEVTLALLTKGDMFGEMALIENKPRSANAIAHSDCDLMVVNRTNFNQMVATQPQLISKLTTTLAERLWSMYRQLDNANLGDPLAKLVDILSLQIEKMKVPGIISKQSLQTELTIKDLINLSSLPNHLQAQASYDFQLQPNYKIVNGKIFVKDVLELTKQAAFYRKQNNAK